VLYDKEILNEITQQLKTDHTAFSTKDRMGLISDSFALCHSNLMDCNSTLELLSYLPKERSYGPMVVAINHFEKWRRILKYTECYLFLNEYMKATLAKSVKEFGWKDVGSDEVKLIRPQILLASVLWENTDSIKEAKTLLYGQLMNGTKIAPNLREVSLLLNCNKI
jgi:ERAP1-like C-terminal domain